MTTSSTRFSDALDNNELSLISPAIIEYTILQKHNPRLKIVCILKSWGPVWLSAFQQMMPAQQSDLLWPDISYFWKNG